MKTVVSYSGIRS